MLGIEAQRGDAPKTSLDSSQLPSRRMIFPEVSMNYKVVLHESEEGFSISCPGLPGCWSQGATEAEALENIQDAIREYLAANRRSRQRPKCPRSEGGPLAVPKIPGVNHLDAIWALHSLSCSLLIAAPSQLRHWDSG